MFWAGTALLGMMGWLSHLSTRALYSWKFTEGLGELVQNLEFWLSVASCPVPEFRFSSLL